MGGGGDEHILPRSTVVCMNRNMLGLGVAHLFVLEVEIALVGIRHLLSEQFFVSVQEGRDSLQLWTVSRRFHVRPYIHPGRKRARTTAAAASTSSGDVTDRQ